MFVVLFKINGRRSCMQYLEVVAVFYDVLLRNVSCVLHQLVVYSILNKTKNMYFNLLCNTI
jgi:hypothetical protein